MRWSRDRVGTLAPDSRRNTMAKNVLGEDLQSCSTDPMTGWHRNGLCEIGGGDHGLHCVCAVMSDEFDH